MLDYLKYLQDVLGLKTVVLPTDSLPSEKAKFFKRNGPIDQIHNLQFELVFLNILTQPKESLFLPATSELFEKIKLAMKLRNIQFAEFDCVVEDRSQIPSEFYKFFSSKVVVLFSSFPQNLGEMRIIGSGLWLETYSPAYLVEDPSAKKVVWSDLQKVMRELNL
jgi:hypothetical protein